MDSKHLDLLGELRRDLAQIREEPQQHLDVSLLEQLKTQLQGLKSPAKVSASLSLLTDCTSPTVSNTLSSPATLIPELLAVLPTRGPDLEAVCSLLGKLIQPLTFAEVISCISGPSSLVEALRSRSRDVNLLAIDVLRKAAFNASDAAVVAGMKDLVFELLSAYFLYDTEVSSAIVSLLGDLMTTDLDGYDKDNQDVTMTGTTDGTRNPHAGHGMMWMRLFDDKDIYSKFFTLTSLKSTDPAVEHVGKAQRTIAQARLLSLITLLAKLDFDRIQASHFPDVEASFGIESGKGGLLEYASLHMVDTTGDVVMQLTLVNFFASFIEAFKPDAVSPATSSVSRDSSAALDYVLSRGIHFRVLSYYLQPDPSQADSLESNLLMGKAANYLATYASTYPDHLMAATTEDGKASLASRILRTINSAMQVSWARARINPPSLHLHVLASLPRIALLPRMRVNGRDLEPLSWDDSPVSKIKVLLAHEDYYKTLATLFHGPSESTSAAGSADRGGRHPERMADTEAPAARALFLTYLHHHQHFFSNVIKMSENLGMFENAMAAVGLLSAVVTANWKPLPTIPGNDGIFGFVLPTEQQLERVVESGPLALPLPSTGPAVIAESSIMGMVIGRFRPMTEDAQSLLSKRHDPRNTAYRMAIARHTLLRKLNDALKDYTGPGLSEVDRQDLALAVSNGAFLSGGSGRGNSVATMGT